MKVTVAALFITILLVMFIAKWYVEAREEDKEILKKQKEEEEMAKKRYLEETETSTSEPVLKELTEDERDLYLARITFLENYTKSVQSAFTQNTMSKKQYREELEWIDSKISELEAEYFH